LTQPSAPDTKDSARGTVLAFDFGLKRTGVALGELELGLAHPLATIAGENNEQRFSMIAALVAEWKPKLLVVGLSTHANGTENEMSAQCRRFARRLEGRFNIRTVLVDERFSSTSASEALREAGIRGRKQKPMLDQVAAQEILQAFFDSGAQTPHRSS
jgi:putative holliday junction resolvase